jgi:seryl-tRNA synthetase
MMTFKALLLGAGMTLALAGAAQAADASIENRLRDQLRSTVTQLRELQDQQAMLQAQKSAAEQERDALKKKVGGGAVSAKATAQAAALRRSLASTREEADALKQTAAEKDAELASLKQQLDQAQAALHAQQSEDEALKATLASTSSTLEACKVKNVELIRLGHEILDRYKKVGIGTVVGAKEPFTGLKRVQLQNIAQDYGDRLYSGRYDPRRDKAPPKPPEADNVTQPSSH